MGVRASIWRLLFGRPDGYRRTIWRALRQVDAEGPEWSKSPQTADAAPPPEEVRYVDVMASSALGEDDVTEVHVEGRQLAISRVGGMLYAIDNTCPHAGAALSDGDLDGRNLLCPDHGWSFDLATGACAIDPSSSVNAYRIRQRDGRIEVALTTGDVAASVGSR